jgi:hypothetical protein
MTIGCGGSKIIRSKVRGRDNSPPNNCRAPSWPEFLPIVTKMPSRFAPQSVGEVDHRRFLPEHLLYRAAA